MGLENLSNPFNDISQNSIEKVDKANSPVSDLSENASNFGIYSENPITDAVFANQSIILQSKQSLIEGDEHTFGSNGEHNNLILIDKIDIQQSDSPLALSDNPDIRKKEINPEIGKNNRLGVGDFVFDTLYNVNQTVKTDRILIDTGRTDENGKKVTINTMAHCLLYTSPSPRDRG